LFGQKYGYAIQDQDGHLSIEGILAGKYREYPFLIRVGPPGLYSVTFIAKSPRKEVADVGAMEFKDQVTWAAQVFVKVK